ncbi:MAG: phosphate acyltransferase PlsX [Anaeroplasma bactoclasticum]|nr:phosphate acyltransferase PlsX [Anaeroplasma bactoclasticum]
MIRLAIDAAGGDYGYQTTIPACQAIIKENPDVTLVLFGDEEIIQKELGGPIDRIEIVHAPRLIDMGEKDPIHEIRKNKDTSMVMAFQAVKDKTVDGVVTCGPTQGVIVAAHLIIRRIKGMKRVALCPNVPSFQETGAIMLDVGANTDIKPEYILQYAQFANIYAKEVKGIVHPKCYLLNIGTEPGKGRELEKEVYQLLAASELNFLGNLEPKELLTSDADIIITDGFTGNVAMKSFEGTAKAFGRALKEEIKSSLGGKIGYLFMRKNLKRFQERFSADKIGGATLFGVDGIVIKAHGASSPEAYQNAIRLAYKAVQKDIVCKMKTYLETHPLEEKTDVE